MKYLKLFEAFSFPSNRQSETIKTIKEVFADVEDIYPQITISVGQYKDEFTLRMKISEFLKKDEIKSFYNDIINPKLNYLSENNIKPIKIGRVERFFDDDYKYFEFLGYSTNHNSTEFKISFKGF